MTLKVLNKLWRLKLPREKLEEIATSLGSDIPFFLQSGIQRGRGRGEILEKIMLLKNFPREVLVVIPEFRVSTEEAFKSWQIHSGKSRQYTAYSIQNDLEVVAFKQFPELKKIKTELKKAGAEFASLSGSGSAVFGLFGKCEEVEGAAKKLERYGKIFITKVRE